MAQQEIKASRVLAGVEDLLFDGTLPRVVEQQRGYKNLVPVTKIYAGTIPFAGKAGQNGYISIKDAIEDNTSKINGNTTKINQNTTKINQNAGNISTNAGKVNLLNTKVTTLENAPAIPNATTTVKGIVELATTTEALGTSSTLGLTPAGATAVINNLGVAGLASRLSALETKCANKGCSASSSGSSGGKLVIKNKLTTSGTIDIQSTCLVISTVKVEINIDTNFSPLYWVEVNGVQQNPTGNFIHVLNLVYGDIISTNLTGGGGELCTVKVL